MAGQAVEGEVKPTESIVSSGISSGAPTEADPIQQKEEMAHTADKQTDGQVVGEHADGEGWLSRIQRKSSDKVSHEDATIPLAWQALLTGLVDALLYARSTIWTGFQTGNMVQFSQNIAQYMLPGVEKFPLLTLERALSVTSFLVASFVGAKLGNRFGHSTRGWMTGSAVLQSLLLFGASAILLSRPEGEAPDFHYFPPVIVLTALSMGMQSVAAQKLSSPAFATTVAFTATLTQIASDPFLFHLGLAPVEQAKAKRRRRKRARTLEGQAAAQDAAISTEEPKLISLGRDRRMLGIFALCTGAGVAECLLQSRAGLRGGLTVAAGFKLIQAVLWFVAPKGKPA